MPNLKIIRQGNTALALGRPLVVAIVGGTTGIGSYTARALARNFAQHGAKLRVYIIGRNASSAESHMAYGLATAPGSEWHFIAAENVALLSDVDKMCMKIIEAENTSPFASGPPRLDVLYMSAALTPLQPSPLTSEGLDSQLSLLYYSRLRFITRLTPLLSASPSSARVISIFAGNVEDGLPPSGSLPIGPIPKDEYGVTAVRRYATFQKTFAFEHLASQHAGKISFTHIYPGLVDGPNFYNSDVNPLWFRVVWRLLKPLAWWYVTGSEDCGDLMVHLATKRYPAKGEGVDEEGVAGDVAFSSTRERGGGAYAVGRRGDEGEEVSWQSVRKGDTEERVWAHLMEVFEGVNRLDGGK
ncbi:hypothetical protein DE146DRAFT_638446 [Phaeosphaeria sp. MPI-PUGE-AT-0046c]|nr:hypothetical protein DE146DRAFT_638446 [Phaeosphaeria sp. MPI-PUGE-AT-0046c]